MGGVSHSCRGFWFSLHEGGGGEELTEAWLLVLPSRGQLALRVLLQMVWEDVGGQKQSGWIGARVAVAEGVN